MKKMNLNATLGLALPLLLLVSCATPAFVEKDESADLSSYKTFAWIESDKKTQKNKNNSLLESSVRDAVNKELAKEGWKEVKNKPDVLVSYDVLVERTTKERNDPVYSRPFSRVYYNPFYRRYGTIYYPSTFMGYDNNEVSVREGTLTITMVDTKTDRTVWQGWTTDEVNSRNISSKEAQSAVRSIFRKFDVAKR
jgi:hypothetical protein